MDLEATTTAEFRDQRLFREHEKVLREQRKEKAKRMNCPHTEFTTTAKVHTRQSGRQLVTFQLRCDQCGELANFLGLQNKLDLNGASVSFDGKEVRLAIEMPLTKE